MNTLTFSVYLYGSSFDVDHSETFGFEFHLRSLPCAFSKQLAFVLVVLLSKASSCCYTVLTRPNQDQSTIN